MRQRVGALEPVGGGGVDDDSELRRASGDSLFGRFGF